MGCPKEYSTEKNVRRREMVDGVDIHRIRYIQLARGKKISRLINYFSFTLSALLHLFTLRKYKSVVVYSNPPILPFAAVLANLLFGTKIVFVAYDVYPEVAYASDSIRRGSLIDRGMRGINALLYKRASRVVALTDEMRGFLLENRPGLAPDRVVTISNWAHEKKCCRNTQALARFNYRPDSFVVSYFGNMGICQEMDTLVKAAQQLKNEQNIRFLWIGHGKKKQQIQRYCQNHDMDNVQIHDFLTGQAFEQAVAVSSLCVVSLEKGLKGTCAPSKYYSYLQGGKPVLAVVEQGCYLAKEIRKENIGTAIEIGEVDALVEAIRVLSRRTEDVQQMGVRAQQLYDRCYRIEIGTKKYVDMMEMLLKG